MFRSLILLLSLFLLTFSAHAQGELSDSGESLIIGLESSISIRSTNKEDRSLKNSWGIKNGLIILKKASRRWSLGGALACTIYPGRYTFRSDDPYREHSSEYVREINRRGVGLAKVMTQYQVIQKSRLRPYVRLAAFVSAPFKATEFTHQVEPLYKADSRNTYIWSAEVDYINPSKPVIGGVELGLGFRLYYNQSKSILITGVFEHSIAKSNQNLLYSMRREGDPTIHNLSLHVLIPVLHY